MKHALKQWKQIGNLVDLAPRVALFLDFDGTLAPIRSNPDSVRLGACIRATLVRLAESRSATVAIVTGRSLSDVEKRIGVPGIAIAANHGAEMRLPGFPLLRFFTDEDVELIRLLQNRILSSGIVPRSEIENKGPILAMHFRKVPEKQRPRLLQAFRSAIRPFEPTLKTTMGKMVLEAKPRSLPNKYNAVRFLLTKQPRTTLALCFGDDRTDLDAFRAVRRRGLSFQVGKELGNSSADYLLNGIRDVRETLQRIAVLKC